MSRLWEAADLIKLIGGVDDAGILSKAKKDNILLLQKAMLPLLRQMIKLASGKRWERLTPYLLETTGPTTEGFFVYARINIRNDEGFYYIGETGDWETRAITHYRQTLRHAPDEERRCRSCRDHLRYVRFNRVASPNEWVSVPLIRVHSKLEGRKMERLVIRHTHPSINAKERPFFLDAHREVS